MLKHLNRMIDLSFMNRAFAAALAVVICFNLSAGFLTADTVYADEEQPVSSEEDAGEKDEPKSEEPEDKGNKDGSGSKNDADDPDANKPDPETPSDKPGEQPAEDPEKDPEEKPEKDPEEEPAKEPAKDPEAHADGNSDEEPSEKSSENPEEKPAEEPGEPASGEPAENPSEQQTEEIKYKLSGKGYLPKYKKKNASFSDGVLTIGKKGKRLEAFSISLDNQTGYQGSITYRAYVKKKGWTKWVKSGKTIGTKRKNLRIEAVQIKLTGELAKYYSVEYKAVISSLGDSQGWVQNGAIAGTRKNSKRIEVLQIRLVPVGKNTSSSVIYRLRGQTYGWQRRWSKDGQASGTSSKRIEGITVSLGPTEYLGGITYRTCVQSEGWKSWVSNGSISAGKKKNRRIEALQIKLTGDMADHYDVYYRVYVQSLGWLDWAANGQTAGSSDMYRRIEKIQIVLRGKEEGEPGDLEGIASATPHAYYAASNTNAIMTYKNILDCGYTDPDVFRQKLISNFEYMKDVGYFHMGKMVQGYTDCAGSVSLAYRVALGTARFTKKYKKGTRSDGSQLYGIGINYCGIKSYKDKYGWCRNGTASVNSHFLNTIVKNRKIKYTQVSLDDYSDGVHGWSNDEWVEYLKKTDAKPGDVFVWFNHDWSKTKGQHMTMYAGIGADGIAYEWTASSTYGVILSPLTDRSPQNIFESFTLMKGVADVIGYN
jgi:uncharacterized protein YjdB